jgi:hypothetical protein
VSVGPRHTLPDPYLPAPGLASPGDCLNQRIHLVIMAAWKRQEFCCQFLQPWCLAGKPDRAAGEEVGLGDHPGPLVCLRLVRCHVDGLLPQALNQTMADWRLLDQQCWAAVAVFEVRCSASVPQRGAFRVVHGPRRTPLHASAEPHQQSSRPSRLRTARYPKT